MIWKERGEAVVEGLGYILGALVGDGNMIGDPGCVFWRDRVKEVFH